jgi:secreted protein with Ig-like and vWFA domain
VAAILPNPLSKQPFDFNITTSALTTGVRIENTLKPFKYRNNATRQDDVFFDRLGMPVYINGAQRYQLESSALNLLSGGDTRSVVLVPFTGRVAIQ